MCRGGLHLEREVAGGVRGSGSGCDAGTSGSAGVPSGGGEEAREGCLCKIAGGRGAAMGLQGRETYLGARETIETGKVTSHASVSALERVLASPAVQFGFRWSRP